jgi:hypothetical protein
MTRVNKGPTGKRFLPPPGTARIVSQVSEPTDNRARAWRRRYLCRFHWHRWRTRIFEEESTRYQICLDCGKYRDLPIGGAGFGG